MEYLGFPFVFLSFCALFAFVVKNSDLRPKPDVCIQAQGIEAEIPEALPQAKLSTIGGPGN
jgi:hypothetical protein